MFLMGGWVSTYSLSNTALHFILNFIFQHLFFTIFLLGQRGNKTSRKTNLIGLLFETLKRPAPHFFFHFSFWSRLFCLQKLNIYPLRPTKFLHSPFGNLFPGFTFFNSKNYKRDNNNNITIWWLSLSNCISYMFCLLILLEFDSGSRTRFR